MTTNRKKDKKAATVDKNVIVSQVYRLGQTKGITDRILLDRIAGRVMEYSSANRPLPGWEQIAPGSSAALSEGQIESIMSEVMSGTPVEQVLPARP